MPATSPAAKARQRLRVRRMMAQYRREFPEKATATLRACYWRKRVRHLTEQLVAAKVKRTEWERKVEQLRWRPGRYDNIPVRFRG